MTYRYPQMGRDGPPALEGVSLILRPGTFGLVVGRSGSGKSTLLRCLNGLIPHFHGGEFGGSVTVFGRDPVSLGPRGMAEIVGYVFQDPEAQFVVDRVEDEIAFGLENLGYDRSTIRKRTEDVLDALGIVSLRDRRVTELSGGEKQKVALASALSLYPQVLVLDEPTSQLDPWSAEELFMAVRALNVDFGVTILMAEHRLERVLGYVDLLVAMSEGRAMAGPVRELLGRLDVRPPLMELAYALGWSEIPLTVKEAKVRAHLVLTPPATRQGELPPVGPPLTRLRSLAVSYGMVRALRGIDLDINRGQITAVMGRNGAGKTTLLRAVAGLVKAEGKVETEPDVTVGYLPQDPNALLVGETVWDELALTLRVRSRGAEVAEAVAESLGLSELLEYHPRDLSVGQRELVALGAVMASGASLLLLDEPTRGLDYHEKARLSVALRRYVEAGNAVVMATHDVEAVAKMADRVVILSDGEVVVDGPPRSVLSGSLNFSTQINRVFGDGFITVDDVLTAMRGGGRDSPGP